jgi:hypothetical protein
MGALIALVVIGIFFGIGFFILMAEMSDGSPRTTIASHDDGGYKPSSYPDAGNRINPAESLYVIGPWEKHNPNYSPYIGKNDE